MTEELASKFVFIAPKSTDSGAPKRHIKEIQFGKMAAKIESFVTPEQKKSQEYFQALEDFMMAQYRYLASFIFGCTPQEALAYIMECSDEEIAGMNEKLGLNDPKAPQNAPESQSPNAEILDAP